LLYNKKFIRIKVVLETNQQQSIVSARMWYGNQNADPSYNFSCGSVCNQEETKK